MIIDSYSKIHIPTHDPPASFEDNRDLFSLYFDLYGSVVHDNS